MRCLRIGEAAHLHLADHQRLVGVGGEAASFAGDLGGEAHGGDDRGFLDRHGDDDILAVDEEVEPDAYGEPEHADGVLDHRVGVGQGKGAGLAEPTEIAGADVQFRGETPQPLGDLHLVEAREPARPHARISLALRARVGCTGRGFVARLIDQNAHCTLLSRPSKRPEECAYPM